MFNLSGECVQPTTIKVVGVGGAGCNAINYMQSKQIEGVEYISANTDLQCLQQSQCENVLQLGARNSGGQGAGADPKKGREAAVEDSDAIREYLQGSNMVFIAAGMGGGTGTGSAPVFCEIARKAGALTVAVVTKPFPFEGGGRMKIAEEGLEELRSTVDSLIVIPNGKLLTLLPKEISFLEAFSAANEVLHGAVKGIAELITRVGLINLDFEDVKKVMSKMGDAVIGTGLASGEQRAYEAVQAAIHNPLLEDVDFSGVRGILVNVAAGKEFELKEYKEIGEIIESLADKDALISIGVVVDESMGDELRVTLVATGLEGKGKKVFQSEEQLGENESFSPLPVTLTADLAPERRYDDYEAPAFDRKKKNAGKPPVRTEHQEGEFLNVPAFLRDQAN